MGASPKTSFERDIVFWTVPDTQRELLCDIWRPADGDASGLAVVYLHGGGWTAFDKDFLTRPFFRHLVAQGHTVMDVSYRLCPEEDIFGMIGDVKRAIAWMKANAFRYGVNPEKVVLIGSSAGAHLCLLAGYTPQQPELTPEDLIGTDLSVCGVVSYYGPSDLMAAYEPWRASNPYIKFDKIVLFAPALKMRNRNYLLKTMSPFPGLVVPSFGPEAYRANKGTPIAAYNALFEAAKHFEKNLAITKGNFLMAHVYYAKYYAIKTMNETFFDTLMQHIEDTPADALPGYQLLNVIAKKKAQLLRKDREMYF